MTRQDDLEWEASDVAKHVANAAGHSYDFLTEHGYLHLVMEPGDATRYHVVIVGGSTGDLLFYDYLGGGRVEPTNLVYTVTLAGLGDTYVWDARNRVDSSYVKDKWTRGDRYTARLLAWFLNHLHTTIMGEPLS